MTRTRLVRLVTVGVVGLGLTLAPAVSATAATHAASVKPVEIKREIKEIKAAPAEIKREIK